MFDMWTNCERRSFCAIETTINGNGGGGGGSGGVSGGGGIGNVTGPGSSQQETLADIEHISTIAGSFVSIVSITQTQPRYGTNDAGYDTEHTSLNSDFDESELRRELLRDKWKLLFDMFDPEGFGEITVDEFINALKSPEFISQVPMNKRELLMERAKKAKLPIGPGYITFQDFVNVMSGKRTRSFKCAVHHRDREVCSENDFHLVLEEPPFFKKMVHVIAMEILPEERDRKYYADRYSCWPPPWFIIFITIIEFNGATFRKGSSQRYQPFIYNSTLDFCWFIKNQSRQIFWKIFYQLFKPYSNINHTCPFEHDIIVENLILDGSMLKPIPFPADEYMIKLKVAAYNHYKAEVRIYVIIKD